MFADTPEGARASMIYFTLIETAKANNLEPFSYIKHVVENNSHGSIRRGLRETITLECSTGICQVTSI